MLDRSMMRLGVMLVAILIRMMLHVGIIVADGDVSIVSIFGHTDVTGISAGGHRWQCADHRTARGG